MTRRSRHPRHSAPPPIPTLADLRCPSAKVAYRSQAAADSAARDLWRQRRHVVESYHCPHCNRWHLAHARHR